MAETVTKTTLFPGSGGSEMDEREVANATGAGGTAHRAVVAIGTGDTTGETVDTVSDAGVSKLQVKDVSANTSLTSVLTSLANILAQLQATLAVSGTVAVSNQPSQPLTDAQLRVTAVPVSVASLPLPTDAATQTTLALIKAKTDNLDVALSTRTKPADAQHVIIDSMPADESGLTDVQLRAVAVPVSGTVAVSNHPANLTDAQLRATAVPVSGTVAVSNHPANLTDAQLRATAVPVSAASLPLPAGAATEATLATRTRPTDQQETIDPYLQQRFETTATIIYVGFAVRGTAASAAAWKIKKTDLDVLGNPTQTRWTSLTGVWDNRVTETYT